MAHQVSSDRVVVGRVSDAFGIRGQVKVRAFTDSPETLLGYTRWTLEIRAGETLPFLVESAHLQGRFLIAQLGGIETRDQALDLKGCDISIGIEELPALPAGEFYHFQLIGLEVVDVDGHSYGCVEEIMQTGANDVLITKGTATYLIPYIPDVVHEVDLDARIIRVRWHQDL